MRNDVVFLVVDDDEIDRAFIKRAFKKHGIINRVEEAEDGRAGLEKLCSLMHKVAAPRPVVVLLDIKMPRLDGFEFLEHIRKDGSLKAAVVFVLSSSSAPNDVARAYDHNIAGYVSKGRDNVETLLSELVRSYCNIVEFP